MLSPEKVKNNHMWNGFNVFKIKTSSMLGSTIHRHCEVGRGEQLTRRQQLGDRAPNRFGMNDACKKKSCWGLGLNDGNSEDSLPPQ